MTRGSSRLAGLVWLAVLTGSLAGHPSAGWAREAEDSRRGVAVDVGIIRVDAPLDAGGKYELPPVRVRNPGAVSASYSLDIEPMPSDRIPAPADWFTVVPTTIHLVPGARQTTTTELTVPAGAEAGEYEALLVARLAGERGNARVGAAAGTRLIFTVAAPSSQEPEPTAGTVSVLWLIAVMVAVVVVLGRTLPRYRLRVERRR
jgi:hypothetical protein